MSAQPTYFVGPWELSTATAYLPERPGAGTVLLVESTDKGAALPWHRKKLVLVLSALRHLRDELRGAGHHVEHRAASSYAAGILAHLRQAGPRKVFVQAPAEWGIAKSIAAAAETAQREGLGIIEILPDRRFLTSRADFAAWAGGRKMLRMEDFYRLQRRRLGVLVDGRGEPEGGTWNLDGENRQTARALRKRGLPPPPYCAAPDEVTREVMALVEGMPDKWGSTAGFDLPQHRAQALLQLDDFLDHRLADFGPYEDAMLAGELTCYHSRLSSAMNIGLLHPQEIIAAAVARYRAGRAPLRSIEGFVRQIIGWREYVNGVYWLRMPSYRSENYFGHNRSLPRAYWEPEATDLSCLQGTVRLVRDHGYAHHIHRLMVLCNFATLVGVHPLRLSEWFWAAFTDAMEWVELPNVVGMGSFADGGLLSSKPYVSGAAYLGRMSDYCSGCRYDPTKRSGDDACPFNYLYWTFLDEVRRSGLSVGQRMAVVLKALERLPATELAAMHASRRRFLEKLEPETTGWTFHHDQG